MASILGMGRAHKGQVKIGVDVSGKMPEAVSAVFRKTRAGDHVGKLTK